MAIIYRAANENLKEIEAYIAEKTAKENVWEAEQKKKRPLLLTIYLFLIAVIVGAVAFTLFMPGVMDSIVSAVEDTLNQWADALSISYDDLENADYSGDTGERISSGILGFIGIILGTIAAALLRLLGWLSYILILAIILALALLLLRLCLGGIESVGWRSATDEEIRDRVLRNMDGRMKGLLAGVEGEDRALEAVSGLNDDCYVFSNMVIRLDGYKNETDLIVVTPSGLTMIEVKNYSGIIMGDLSAPEITQCKHHGRKVINENRSNPVIQIEAPAGKLEEFLKRKGVPSTVRRCALFIHDNVELRVTDYKGLSKKCPLFLRESGSLIQYLHSNKRCLSEEEVEKLVAALCTFL